MNVSERVLYHQIHPCKLGPDISAAMLSSYLLWQHRLRLALFMNLAPPFVPGAALLRWASLEPQRQSAFGRYIEQAMTRPMEMVRLSGTFIMMAGAWYRRPRLLGLGLVVVLFGWFRGCALAKVTAPAGWARAYRTPTPGPLLLSVALALPGSEGVGFFFHAGQSRVVVRELNGVCFTFVGAARLLDSSVCRQR
jgi:hypothetical protein